MESPVASRRLRSLDALRGFDMLWIIGLGTLFRALPEVTDSPALEAWAVQLEHVPWAGLRAYDLIFPLFMFLAGVAIPWSVGAKVERGKIKNSFIILRRAALLVLLGMIYNGLLDFNFETLRVASVLGQIGLAYAIAALIWVHLKKPLARASSIIVILASVAIAQLLIPVPDHGAGVLTEEGIINGWIDRTFLPGRLYGGSFDPEGLLCIFSASALVLVGAFAGELLKKQAAPHLANVGIFLAAGSLLGLLGWACQSLGYPPIKAAWTTTFNLYAAGISLALLAIFHLAIDFPRFNWSLPLQIVGMNPLTIYLLARVVPFGIIATFFFSGLAGLGSSWREVILAAGTLLIEWFVLLLLYRKKIFLRV